MRGAIALIALCCAAQVSSPLIGYVRDRAGDLRPLFGVAGALVAGDPIETGVLAASFTGKAGLAKRATELVEYSRGTVVRRMEAPEGTAEFGFTAEGHPAWVRFDKNVCWVWQGGAPVPAAECPTADAEPERIGPGWISTRDQEGVWAIRTDREGTYRVPEGASK